MIKPRVYQFVTVEPQPVKPAKLAALLKSLYGVGGARGEFGSGLRGFDYNGKGIELQWTDVDGEHQAVFSWNKVAAKILQLIRDGRYDESFAPFPPVEQEWTLFDYALHLKKQISVGDEQEASEQTTIRLEEVTNQDNSDLETGYENDESAVKTSNTPTLSPTRSNAVNFRFNPETSPYVSGPKSKYKRNVQRRGILPSLLFIPSRSLLNTSMPRCIVLVLRMERAVNC
ncbi:hypothetical protein ABD76_24750 [Paenibacillus dendritiformis]|uniref:hypothetical protein n=1 Tax=Paenibacillus dendritiformis TaxID=130049 RepID=UPI0018CC7CD5|nr:hypothetical protein [Paenibacillus dendritiformis]MBG9795491.1 hypothetical protein [Paenibacillus dendritiformis]